MPELALYFTFVLGFIAFIISVALGTWLVLGLYHAISWARQRFVPFRHLTLSLRQKKATVIVLPVHRKANNFCACCSATATEAGRSLRSRSTPKARNLARLHVAFTRGARQTARQPCPPYL